MKKNLYLTIVLLLSSFLFAYANTQTTLWSENFEGDWTANWHADAGTWEGGIPTSGPNAAHGGDKCAATVLGGNYTEPVTSRLIRHSSFTVPSASENPRLRFWHWYSFSQSDNGKVQVKVDGTKEWVDVSTSYTSTGSNTWTYPSVDLSDYAGQSVQIAFYFYSVQYSSYTNVSSGWYIDDVELVTGPVVANNPEDWENGIGNWASERGTWEVGVPSKGPGAAYNGQQCAATVLNGNYAEPVSSRLISPIYNIPSASENPRLRFWHWYSFSQSDYGKVQVKVDGTKEWVDIPSANYTNTSGNIWTYTYFSLSDYAGQSVQIAFYFYSVQYSSYTNISSGWYIDDIVIEPNSTKSNKTDILTYSFGTPPQTVDATIDATAKTITIEVENGTVLTNLVSTFTLSDGATAEVGAVAQVSGTTENDFSSPVTYIVTAEDGTTTQDWVVTVTKALVLNDETDFLTYNFGTPPQTVDATIDATAKTITIEVENGTVLTNLVSTFTLSDGATAKVGAVAQASGTTGNDFSSPVTYTVTAEDGTTTQDWVVTVTEAVLLNDETDFLTFSFGTPPQTGDVTIDATAKTITIEVENGTDLTNLVSTFTLSDGATAKVGAVEQVSGTTANDFTSPVTYTVTAEDGTTTQDWLVTVTETVVLSDETDFLTYSFGTPPQTGNATINPTAKTIEIEVENGTVLTNLVSTFTLSDGASAKVGAVAQVSGTTANNFTATVTYKVTAEDGTTVQDWEVSVSVAVALSNETAILSYGFGIPPQTGAATINATNHSINIEVENGTVITNLVSIFTLSDGASAKVGAVAQVSGTTGNNFTNPVIYTVTAEDGTTVQDWEVAVSVATALSNETAILTYGFGIPPQIGAATINSTNHTINIEVENGTEVTNLVSTFSLSPGAVAKIGGAIQFSGTTANDFSTPVTYSVTAENGTTVQDWELTVTVAPNTETDIIDFAFGTPPQTGVATINATAKTIGIEVEYGTALTNLISTFTLSNGASAKVGGAEQVSGTSTNDFSSPLTYTVTAEDGITVQNWVVTVNVKPNSETEIIDFTFGTPPQTGNASIHATAKTIEIEVGTGTDLTNLVSTFTLSDGATAKVGGVAQVSGTTANNFTNPVTYTVTAEDGTTTQDWIVTVTIATGINEIALHSLKIYPNPFSERTTIELDNIENSKYSLVIFNMAGNKVLEMMDITSDKIELKRGNLTAGVYIVELKGAINYGYKRIVIR